MRLKSVHKKATTSMLYLDSLDKNTTGLLEVIFLGIKRLNHLLPAKNVNACNHFHKFYCVLTVKFSIPLIYGNRLTRRLYFSITQRLYFSIMALYSGQIKACRLHVLHSQP